MVSVFVSVSVFVFEIIMVGHHPEPQHHHQHEEDWRRPSHATFTRSEVPRPSCSRDWTFLVALALSGAPLWCSSWNRRAWGLVGVPIKVSVQLGSIWEALAGEEEPGGREEQRTSGDGRRGVGKRQHSGGVPF